MPIPPYDRMTSAERAIADHYEAIARQAPPTATSATTTTTTATLPEKVAPSAGVWTTEFALQVLDRVTVAGVIAVMVFVPNVNWKEMIPAAVLLAGQLFGGGVYAQARAKVKTEGEVK